MMFSVLLSLTIRANACGGITGYLSNSSYVARCCCLGFLLASAPFLAIVRPPPVCETRLRSVMTFRQFECPYGASQRLDNQSDTNSSRFFRSASFGNVLSAWPIISPRPQPFSLSSLANKSSSEPSSERPLD